MLNYKNYLLNKLNTSGDGIVFWQDLVVMYCDYLGYNGDFYECWNFLKTIDESKYNGEGENPKANFYVYDTITNTLNWFTHYKDAMMCSSIDDCAMETASIELFMRWRRKIRDGYCWLLPDDLSELDDIISQPRHILCETREIEFDTMDEAVTWLVNSGAAANPNSAKKSLEKHLKGESSSCYKMKFTLC